ncbi:MULTISPECIES: hypothetical protein [unclassified Alteromonas]|uniref:hypothetical protein n=1 Tax=unclassified Alteromonas TaxID=2614992 RepID=UPI00050969AB|nr:MULTISPECIES: hypothetical protein [unclassified Alteromonas]
MKKHCLLLIFYFAGYADDGFLRGNVKPSEDGLTYFGVLDDNGGHYGQLLLDGQRWELTLGKVALIEPGEHILQCGASITFTIPEGIVYKFDYWGP